MTTSPFKTAADLSALAGLEERTYRTRIRPLGWEPPPGATRGGGHAILLGSHESNSPEWHALRAERIGGSEIGSIAGLTKYASRFKLWHEKKGTLPLEDISHKPAIEWGHRLEPVVGAKLIENRPWLNLAPQVGTFVHSERPWQLANPDLLGDHAIGEVKTAAYDYAWGEPGTDQIPISYRAQVLWYMDVLGLDVAYVCVLISGKDYREFEVRYDLADALYLRGLGEEFMASLAAGIEPEPDGSLTTGEALATLSPDTVDSSLDVQIPPALAAQYEKALRDFEAAETEKKRTSNMILRAIGGGRRAMVGERAIAARARGRWGIYLRADGKLLATKPGVSSAPRFPTQGNAPAAETVDMDAAIRGVIAGCTTSDQIRANAASLAQQHAISEATKRWINEQWRALKQAETGL